MKNFTNNLKPLKSYFKHLGSDADMDWRTLFLLFVAGLIAICIFNIIGFTSLKKEMEGPVSGNGEEANLINTETLTEVLEEYDQKAMNLDILLRGGAVDQAEEAR